MLLGTFSCVHPIPGFPSMEYGEGHEPMGKAPVDLLMALARSMLHAFDTTGNDRQAL